MYTHTPYYNMNQYGPHYRSTYKNRFEMGFMSGLLSSVPLPVIIGGVLLVVVIAVIASRKTGPEYVGCYQDGPQRTMPTYHMHPATRDQCREKAKQAKHKYFALQYWPGDGNKETGHCFSSNDLPPEKIDGCQSGGAYPVGGGYQNAVYKTN